MPVEIDYESEDFLPTSTVSNGTSVLTTTWDDIIWAAVTVGRPNRGYVFRHGRASYYEALFRWSLTRMALEQSGPSARRLRRTSAVKTLDPTEKGMVNYFLGMTFCKLFASALLDTPWLLHLDVFRPYLNPLILTSRSRPDLVGQQSSTGEWHAFESKGRASKPSQDAKDKAKEQANRLVSVVGSDCKLHIGAFSFYRGDVLQFYWRDPEPKKLKSIEILELGEAWQYYYSPVWDVVRRAQAIQFEDVNMFVAVPEADLEVSIHPDVARALSKSQWQLAKEVAFERGRDFAALGYKPDGLKVRAGESWKRRFVDE
jgi:hypothetical protein